MRQVGLVIFVCFMWTSGVQAQQGLVTVKSAHSVTLTADRLESLVREQGMTVFARINHAAGATKVGQMLRPTELLIFGNPKVGTPFMQCSHSVGIDLPQKALVWEDTAGQVHLTYNDPAYLAARHGAMRCGTLITKISEALQHFARAATSP